MISKTNNHKKINYPITIYKAMNRQANERNNEKKN